MADLVTLVWPYLAMLVSSFGAATLLPGSSELVLIAGLRSGTVHAPSWLAVATIGNVAGSLFNWWLGLNARRFEGRRWFPFKAGEIERASERFRRWGVWTLLLAWAPVVGDPLTFIAGVLRVPLALFLALVTIGKAARYLVLAWGVSG